MFICLVKTIIWDDQVGKQGQELPKDGWMVQKACWPPPSVPGGDSLRVGAWISEPCMNK